MKVKEIKGFTLMEAEEGMKLRLRGSKVEPMSKMPVAAGRTTADYEEIALEVYQREQAEAARLAAYRTEVERLIGERYSVGQEIQFAREKELAGTDYADYLAYVEQCKERAKGAMVANSNS